MKRLATRAAGFTLIELMIVLLIMGLVTSQMFMVFSAQRRVFVANERALDVQEGARLVADLIAHDARLAGFMVARMAGVSSMDGGANGPDRFCVSDATYFDTPLGGGAAPTMDNTGNHFPGGQVLSLAGTQVQLISVAELDIDASGAGPTGGCTANCAVDFVAGNGIILSDGTLTFCGRILNIAGSTINLVAGHTAGGIFIVAGSVRAVPAIVYELNPAPNLMRNGLVLSTSVEDLQIEYWVDTQVPDGQIGGVEFPVNDLNNPPGGLVVLTDEIRRIRISVVTRTAQGDNQEGQRFDRQRPAVANRVAGARDSFDRRRFTVSVLPRNML